MKLHYMVEEEAIRDEAGTHVAFGIAAYDEDGACVASVSSVFFERDRAEQFVAVCNRLSLSPRHLNEVADDILAE